MSNEFISPNTFVRSIESHIEHSNNHGSEFSVVLLSTKAGLIGAERAKLLEWGEVVLRNHAPPGATVFKDRGRGSCAMLLPALEPVQAEAIACYFGEQLNRLPVLGAAPGQGWEWQCQSYPRHADGIADLCRRFDGREDGV